MRAAKRGKDLRIARLPIAEFDGRTGPIGTIAGGQSEGAAASLIGISPADLGIFAGLAAI
jgi:hypothetical protein